MFQTRQHTVSNGAGWDLAIAQAYDPLKLVPGRAPVLIVPGYGMSSFIFGFHPNGPSFERYLADAGFEVWRADLRGQGDSARRDGTDVYGLAELAQEDIGAVVGAVLDRTRTRSSRVDVIGCSLGGTIALLYAALAREPRIGKRVAMGTPVRWIKVHPMVRAAFFSPWLAGVVPVRGTRAAAQVLLPQVARLAPGLLRMYLNPDIVDLGAAREMTRTVEDPNRHVNREIALWIKARDLVARGTNLSEAIARMPEPLLVVIANGDGIVPRETAEFLLSASTANITSRLDVGTAELRMAHADMFVSNHAQERVFRPIAGWLADPR